MFDAAAKERLKAGQSAGGKIKAGCSPEILPESRRDSRDAVGQAFGVCGKLVDAARVVNRYRRIDRIHG